MNKILEIESEDKHVFFSREQMIKIKSLYIPSKIHLRSADVFDDKNIFAETNDWVFHYSGSQSHINFKTDDYTTKIMKYILFHYASSKSPGTIYRVHRAWIGAIEYTSKQGMFNFQLLRSFLEKESVLPTHFFYIIFGLKILCIDEFPGFTLDDYEDLEFIPRPNSNDWSVYQNIDNIFEPVEKNMISKGLFEMATAISRGRNYNLVDLRNATVLGLCYVTGGRPVQLAKLAAGDFRIDTCNTTTGLVRYSVLLPYAKQRHVTTDRLILALPPEIGVLVNHYIDKARLLPTDKMFDMGASATKFVSQSIRQTILNFSPPDYQDAVARGEAAPPSITPTDLRHNVGHSLAMQGVSAEEIAHILGHSSLVVAKHYILATPALALIRAKALGSNPVWQNMVAMMMTGKLVPSKEWQGIENFDTFIVEQKAWFEENLAADFAESWDSLVWICGKKGSGWLRGNGVNVLRFDEINRLKGIDEHYTVSDTYQLFMKAMLVLVYRGRNRSISPAVAIATLIILKRWYCALIKLTGQTHPIYLATDVVRSAMDTMSAASKPGDPNIANYKGRCVKIQKLVNHHAFTLVTLHYVSDENYTNRTNLTQKARETIALKHKDRLDDTVTDGEDALITIRGFLNIVSLIQRVENGTEKIALNCLLLLIITGFRSIEAFNLRLDALVKRKIDNADISRRLRDKGLPDYFLGIRYVGVKGAGERTHWVEPLAVPLVENIFKSVKSLTCELRKHLINLRLKGFADYLPEAISDIAGELVELDDIVEHIAQSSSELRGRAGLRDKASKALAKRGCIPTEVILFPGNEKRKYYSKSDLSLYLKNEFGDSSANTPCTHSWVENGKRFEIMYEDLLFLYPKGSMTLKRALGLKATPLPLSNAGVNKFLGNVDGYASVFSKYRLLEDDGRPTQLRTHIPRHNINTFLAIAEISDHLQAMLMGRVDITQNKHYQHLALKERRKAASLIPLVPIIQEQTTPITIDADTPLDVVKQSGMMIFSSTKNLETNIKANLHTFDNRDDVAGFIEASLDDGLFEDIAAAFEDISKNEGPSQATEMVHRHAVLHPLKLGSCMRDVNLWGCPYRMKCQALKPCEHFTLTGRIDEYSTIEAKGRALNEATFAFEQYTATFPGNQLMQGNIEENLAQLDALTKQLRSRSNSLEAIPSQVVLSGEIKVEGEIRTLAQLFALEYQKIKQGED